MVVKYNTYIITTSVNTVPILAYIVKSLYEYQFPIVFNKYKHYLYGHVNNTSSDFKLDIYDMLSKIFHTEEEVVLTNIKIINTLVYIELRSEKGKEL